ncbi:MAG: acetyl-CoA carboxylase biotin carboxylase subunit [Planctomycetaceae bacterium]|jgi:acetyl-CoA carboxylase biotin carboxylase subunit|nr:acetyl-CoA carboxylase biotin carboxylase subunit [Planctomycetaceae bacterium]
MFQRILVANRGEIALRIIRACRELGVETVAVFSETDRGSAYLDLADEAICIGPPKSAESYLKIKSIISACEVSGAEAVHPGYGFLAENAHFADVCRDSGYEFIGPSSDAMRLLGDKNAAREAAAKAGVPRVPGSDGLVQSDADALKFARNVRFPVLIKASAGGGGRGMRVARDTEQLKGAIQQAQQEAQSAFGNGDVYLEKYVENPRHVEVQIVADKHANAVHLWERDCSMQRRHQKLIEESPAPNLKRATREAMCKAAVKLVKEAGYYNAGTIEFIVDKDENFYFIEMNARIQVEHPVTELVTGIDLIKTQIRVASGEPLPFKQSDIKQTGWAIECRVNAEDPEHNFRPCPGRIEKLIIPGGFGVRFDSHVHSGYSVPPTYDSMVGKLLVHQNTRQEAIDCMRRCLTELKVEGIKTSAPLQLKILESKEFQSGNIDTGLIERKFMQPKVPT